LRGFLINTEILEIILSQQCQCLEIIAAISGKTTLIKDKYIIKDYPIGTVANSFTLA
jgi:hypothetical protein